MGSIIPCMAAQPPQLPINDPMSIPSVGDSIPKRDSYDTDEEYHIALTTWKREGVNHITSHIQSHVLSGTMTPELMERFNSEIEKINLLNNLFKSFKNDKIVTTFFAEILRSERCKSMKIL